MKNALTVDVEDWYQTNGLDLEVSEWSRYENRIEGSTRKVLELLERYDTKGTFFVLGCVAERHPLLVREIVERGHEIGSHGGWHRMLTKLTPEQFREDLRYARDALEAAAGIKVRMFRAPSWSITPDKYGLLRVLQEEGYAVDSSLQPFRTPLSGIRNAPTRPFYPTLQQEQLELLEFPSTVLKLGGTAIPFSGGFYLRALPYWFVERALRRVNREGPGMVYVHPWELDPAQPRLTKGISPLVRLAQYYRLSSTETKLEKLLQRFQFVPLGSIIEEEAERYPAIRLA